MKSKIKRVDILREQVRKSYLQTTNSAIATMINSLILALILWPQVEGLRIAIWLGTVYSIVLYRLWLKGWFSNHEPIGDDILAVAKNRLVFIIGLTGAVWGSVAVFLFPADSISHQVFIAFVLGGMVAGLHGAVFHPSGIVHCVQFAGGDADDFSFFYRRR